MKISLRVCLGLLLCLPALGNAQRRAGHEDLGSTESAHAFIGKPVSVAELEQTLTQDGKKRDSALARELFGLRLTERLGGSKLESLKAPLPGRRAKEALVALADESAFLSPPEAELPSLPAPGLPEERQIISLMVTYLGNTIPRLPNFYATRTTAHYDDTEEDENRPGVSLFSGEPLHWGGVSSATVIYRNGEEIVDPGPLKRKQANPEEIGLVTKGTFGPILATVIGDASRSQMMFSRWEQGADGPVAVFNVSVPKEKSHYQVAYRSPSQTQAVEQPTAYHGEISIDPATGTILRVTVEADFEAGIEMEMVRADIMVEYGPVDIGAKRYICPIRSVSLSQGRGKVAVRNAIGFTNRLGPEITRLNDVTFGNYHVFRAEVRVLTGDDPVPGEKP
ncbi:MAG: hypothetical protein ACLPY1_20660 [Terracidiphilus sp.]